MTERRVTAHKNAISVWSDTKEAVVKQSAKEKMQRLKPGK
jgi:hypothetical protein